MLSKHTMPPTISVVLTVLLITFLSEILVMLLLPHLLPDRAGTAFEGLMDAALLAVLSFPFLWFVVRHLAARNRMEDALLRNENRLRIIIDTIPECALLLAEDGTILDMNRAGLAIIDADSAAQAVGTSIFPRIVPDYRAAVQEFLDEVFLGSAGAIEYEFIGTKGSRRWVETRATPLKDVTGKITMLGICRDITEQKKLEAQMRHSHKMDAIRTLSGGIAHDFNNILTAIIGYSNILKLKLKQDDPARPFVDQILASSERATGLTQSLLAFSRRTATCLKPVNLNETVQRAEKLLHRLIGEDIELQTNLIDGAATVMADAGQIEQILMNLATNARDAMPDGGTLTLSTGVTEIGNNFIRAYGYGNPGAYFVFAVTDTGTGMDDKTRDRIFEPFFTTKEVGKGTGLGLSIVYGIVKTHNGYINCSSTPGHGTTFTIYLPLANPSSFEREAPLSQVPRGGTETILLAEDDPEVRTLSTTFLRNFGYTIIGAENGEDACRRFRENREDISLLLFDVIMPKKDGKEAYEEIKRLSPGIKILFMSGYNTATIADKGITREGLNFVMKPVSPEVLLTKVREVLDT